MGGAIGRARGPSGVHECYRVLCMRPTEGSQAQSRASEGVMRNFAKCSMVSMVTKHAFLADFSTKERATHAHTRGLHTGSTVDGHIYTTSMQHPHTLSRGLARP